MGMRRANMLNHYETFVTMIRYFGVWTVGMHK